MRANILLIEYERRSVDQIRRALAETEHTLEVAGDLHRAVEMTAILSTEPSLANAAGRA
mgnify:CR=1 FL=1